jgi:hypothetical protein
MSRSQSYLINHERISRKASLVVALLAGCVAVSACKKKEAPVEASAPALAHTTAAPAGPASAPSEDEEHAARETADKQKRLDYATMEDQYINDPHGQWASEAKATSTFGDDGGKTPSDVNLAKNMVGAPDGHTWTNNKIDMGFDSFEGSFAKPVTATEVRIVFEGGKGVEGMTKLELEDTDGKWNTVWSGISDVKRDERGERTWFVKKFPATPYKVKAVRGTIANNVDRAYKTVDAIELVGD